jgi:nuclear GTP-binding protein
MIGYPNVGKSSVINTLRKKKVCTVAPIAGETKVWQYITLMKRIYMIDCPGIVPPNQGDSDESLLLRGSIRVENVEYPAQYIEAVMGRVQPKHLQRTYELSGYTDAVTFLELLARKKGRVLKGGEPDLDGCAKIVINDWIRGKLPWFTPPPMKDGEEEGEVKGVEGRVGRLGEMGKKRKRDDETDATASVAATTDGVSTMELSQDEAEEDEDDDEDDDEFEGFTGDEGGLELDVDVDSNVDDSEDDDEGAPTTVAIGEATEEEDDDVDEEIAAISAALSKAKKKQRRT